MFSSGTYSQMSNKPDAGRFNTYSKYHSVKQDNKFLFKKPVKPFRSYLTAEKEGQIETERQKGQVSIGWPILGGLLGGGIGFFGGGFVAGILFPIIERSPVEQTEILGYVIAGAFVGEAIFLPIGVHIGNKGRGNLWLDLLTSVAVAGAGLAVASAISNGNIDNALYLLPIPLLQIGATITVERSTGR